MYLNICSVYDCIIGYFSPDMLPQVKRKVVWLRNIMLTTRSNSLCYSFRYISMWTFFLPPRESSLLIYLLWVQGQYWIFFGVWWYIRILWCSCKWGSYYLLLVHLFWLQIHLIYAASFICLKNCLSLYFRKFSIMFWGVKVHFSYV